MTPTAARAASIHVGVGQQRADHGLVFAHEDGGPLRPESVTKRFGQLVREAGLRPVRLHDLRHGAASLMLAAGVPLAVVSKRLGHSSIGITSDTYSHLLEGVGRDAAERAAALVPRRPRDQSVTNGASTGNGGEPDEGVSAGQTGGRSWVRTSDPRFVRPVLYR